MYAKHSNHRLMTEAEYLAFADAQETKYEYSNGQVYAMTGASVRHNTICANTITHISTQWLTRDCTVTTSDTRIYIASKQAYRYPDITVFCGDAQYLSGRTDTLINPFLLVEVLSPSTAIHDYNQKLEEYTAIESLQAYIIIAQDTPKLEIFRRDGAHKWLYEYARGLESEVSLVLQGAALHLSLAQIYRRIQWDSAPSESEPDGRA